MYDEIVLSPQGRRNLEKELDDLKKNRRRQVAERISIAKEFGDLSENAEYHEAKEEQAFIEGRIIELEHILKVGRVVDQSASKAVNVGSTVHLTRDGKDLTIELVGATEADPTNGKISIDSPLGQAIFDLTVKDEFDLRTPAGLSHYRIEKIV
ncbi:MAG: transcription elongation factor GreA [Candidatus Komeilibacteria bacterium]